MLTDRGGQGGLGTLGGLGGLGRLGRLGRLGELGGRCGSQRPEVVADPDEADAEVGELAVEPVKEGGGISGVAHGATLSVPDPPGEGAST